MRRRGATMVTAGAAGDVLATQASLQGTPLLLLSAFGAASVFGVAALMGPRLLGGARERGALRAREDYRRYREAIEGGA